jgi:uncharacterized lipoprotein YmbA
MRRIRVGFAFVAILCTAACSVGSILQPTKDLSQYYVLTPMDSSARGVPITYSGTEGRKELAIGLGPVKFPAYLARPEIVTRSSPNKVDLSEVERWAEPLDKNFVSVLSQNLTILAGAQLTTFPWSRPTNLNYQIALDITRFDTDSRGTAKIIGLWEIKDPNSGDLLNSGETNLTDAAQSGETHAATLSRAVGDLSVQLADAIRTTKPPAPRPKPD